MTAEQERETYQDGAWYWVEHESWHDKPPIIAPARYKAASKAWYSFEFSGISTRYLKVLEPCSRAPVVPQGWRLVPLEHTEAMRATFEAQQGTSTYFTNTTTRIGDFGERYRAMLAAAPQPPEASGHPPFEMEDGAVAVPPADPTMARFLRTT